MIPDISIIVPVYNAGPYLRASVGSLQHQTHENIEIILVDDGATDNSGAICDQLALEDARIHVMHKVNAGQGLARNDGLTMATGTYVAFLDADDYWEIDSCERILNRLRETGADLCTFAYCKERENGIVIARPAVRQAVYTDDAVRREFVLHYFGDDPLDDDLRSALACMSCFRRSIIVEHNVQFASERKVLSEDTIFCLEFCKHCKVAVTLDEIVLHYVMHATSYSHQVSLERFGKTLAFCKILRGYAASYGLSNDASIARRLQGTVWITVMELVRHAAAGENGKAEVRSLLERKEIQENAAYMAQQPLNKKQRLLAWSICKRLTTAVYLMGRIHP